MDAIKYLADTSAVWKGLWKDIDQSVQNQLDSVGFRRLRLHSLDHLLEFTYVDPNSASASASDKGPEQALHDLHELQNWVETVGQKHLNLTRHTRRLQALSRLNTARRAAAPAPPTPDMSVEDLLGGSSKTQFDKRRQVKGFPCLCLGPRCEEKDSSGLHAKNGVPMKNEGVTIENFNKFVQKHPEYLQTWRGVSPVDFKTGHIIYVVYTEEAMEASTEATIDGKEHCRQPPGIIRDNVDEDVEECPAGMACLNNVIVPCPAGYYSEDGAYSCTPCPEGSYCPLMTSVSVFAGSTVSTRTSLHLMNDLDAATLSDPMELCAEEGEECSWTGSVWYTSGPYWAEAVGDLVVGYCNGENIGYVPRIGSGSSLNPIFMTNYINGNTTHENMTLEDVKQVCEEIDACNGITYRKSDGFFTLRTGVTKAEKSSDHECYMFKDRVVPSNSPYWEQLSPTSSRFCDGKDILEVGSEYTTDADGYALYPDFESAQANCELIPGCNSITFRSEKAETREHKKKFKLRHSTTTSLLPRTNDAEKYEFSCYRLKRTTNNINSLRASLSSICLLLHI